MSERREARRRRSLRSTGDRGREDERLYHPIHGADDEPGHWSLKRGGIGEDPQLAYLLQMFIILSGT